MRHPTHGHLWAAFAVRAGGQHDVQLTRRHCRIVKKHLVEVAETVEQQFLFALFLDLPVLRHHVGCRACGRWRRRRGSLFCHCVRRSYSRSGHSTLPYVPTLVVRMLRPLNLPERQGQHGSNEQAFLVTQVTKMPDCLEKTPLSVTYVTPATLYILVTPPIVAAEIDTHLHFSFPTLSGPAHKGERSHGQN